MSWANIPGWFGFRHIYDQFATEAQDGDVFVEIGVAFGRSVAYLARQLIDKKKNCTIYAIDPWVDDWWDFPHDYPLEARRPAWGGEYAEWARSVGGPFAAFLASMQSHASEELEYITVLREYAHRALPIVVPMCKGVLIDGNHNYPDVKQDIADWSPKVVKGGILAGDDYGPDFPGVIQAVKEAYPEKYANHKGYGDGEYSSTWWVRI